MMKNYDEYKDSGVTWIGSIPQHWNVIRLKFLATIKTGYTPLTSDAENFSEDGIVWVKPDNLNGLNPIVDSKDKVSARGVKQQNMIPSGSVLLCCIGSIGKFGVAGTDLITNQQINSITFNEEVTTRYGQYLAQSCKDEYFKYSNGNVVRILNTTSLSSIFMPVAPIHEQTTIATFLDRKTSEIDTLINKKKQLIALLKEERTAIINHAVTKGINPDVKYKDSGIEWIGEIPEHWQVKRLKHLVKDKLKYGANESAELDNPDFPRYIRITDFGNDGTLKVNTFKSLPPDIANDYLLENGDLLFARSGATVGKTFLFDNYDGKACYAGYLIKASFDNRKVNPKIPYYYSRTTYYENWKESIFQQATIQNIGADKYNQFLIAISPNIDEQKDIVSYIEQKSFAIESIISKTEKEIELMQEYKTALISEVVTGKVDVREEATDKVL